MGESTVITHALLTIVAVTVASTLAGVVIFNLSDLGNSISGLVKMGSEKIKTSVIIAYVSVNTSSTPYVYNIYAKNVGSSHTTNIDLIDIFLGTYGSTLDYYKYGTQGSVGTWNYTEIGNNDGVWDPGETLILHVYSDKLYQSPIEVVLVLPQGVKVSGVEPLS